MIDKAKLVRFKAKLLNIMIKGKYRFLTHNVFLPRFDVNWLVFLDKAKLIKMMLSMPIVKGQPFIIAKLTKVNMIGC